MVTGLRVLAGVAGVLLAGAALALEAWGARVRSLAVFDRPAFTWSRAFPAAFAVLLAAAAIGSAGFGFVAHPALAALLLLALAGVPLARRWARSPERRVRRLAAAFAASEAGSAGADDAVARRARFVRRVRPAWGEELAAQLAQDCADGASLARWIVRLDDAVPTRRAWAGGRPATPRAPGTPPGPRPPRPPDGPR